MMNSNSSYHLRYFNLRARAEPIRWILKAAGVEFTEERIEMSDWGKVKQEFTFGKCPVLVINGTQIHQTTVICRYLSDSHGLAPSDPWHRARLEEVVESVHDISEHLAIAFLARSHKSVTRFAYFIDRAKSRAHELAPVIESQITVQGWIRSEKMTWADLFTGAYYDVFEEYFPSILDTCPKLKKLVNNVRRIPAIKNWLLVRSDLQPFEIIKDE